MSAARVKILTQELLRQYLYFYTSKASKLSTVLPLQTKRERRERAREEQEGRLQRACDLLLSLSLQVLAYEALKLLAYAALRY